MGVNGFIIMVLGEEIMSCLGKRFILAIVTVLCASVVTVLLNYSSEAYLKVIAIIFGPFIIAQSITDVKEKDK